MVGAIPKPRLLRCARDIRNRSTYMAVVGSVSPVAALSVRGVAAHQTPNGPHDLPSLPPLHPPCQADDGVQVVYDVVGRMHLGTHLSDDEVRRIATSASSSSSSSTLHPLSPPDTSPSQPSLVLDQGSSSLGSLGPYVLGTHASSGGGGGGVSGGVGGGPRSPAAFAPAVSTTDDSSRLSMPSFVSLDGGESGDSPGDGLGPVGGGRAGGGGGGGGDGGGGSVGGDGGGGGALARGGNSGRAHDAGPGWQDTSQGAQGQGPDGIPSELLESLHINDQLRWVGVAVGVAVGVGVDVGVSVCRVWGGCVGEGCGVSVWGVGCVGVGVGCRVWGVGVILGVSVWDG
jgi:hypothetical protein